MRIECKIANSTLLKGSGAHKFLPVKSLHLLWFNSVLNHGLLPNHELTEFERLRKIDKL